MEAVTDTLLAIGVARVLDPRVIPLQRVVGAIATAMVSFGAVIALVIAVLASPLPGWAVLPLLAFWVAATGVLAWWAYRWPAVAYRHAAYTVFNDGLEITRGVWWRTVINVPRSRVQHIDVSQGPLERQYQLGTLVVYTAGTDHAQVNLHGLAHDTALAIRDHLLPREGDDAV
jgi:membrane protein YdbS with pleckstrin-like domain